MLTAARMNLRSGSKRYTIPLVYEETQIIPHDQSSTIYTLTLRKKVPHMLLPTYTLSSVTSTVKVGWQ